MQLAKITSTRFIRLELGAVLLSFLLFCVNVFESVCCCCCCTWTLIIWVCSGNFELWKGQMVTFVYDSGLKRGMMWAVPTRLFVHTYTQLQAWAGSGCHCGFDPCFLTLHYCEKSKLESSLFCSSGILCSHSPHHPTPLLLTLARGHPPADGTIPAAFDTEFALQPTAISWFCNKLRRKRCLSLSQLHCCDLIWLQGAEPAKKTSKTRRLSQNK